MNRYQTIGRTMVELRESRASESATLDALLDETAQSLAAGGNEESVVRLNAARARLARPATVVCVVGEFKQGKSSLVNALIGRAVCPVDDDIATSVVTVVRHAAEPSAIVRGRADGEPTARRIQLADVPQIVTDTATDDGLVIDRVEIGIPSGLLEDGLALVDTPGMGGVGAGHAAATLAFLPFADGLIFVTDATQELTAHEIDFLQTARELCPAVMVAVTKTDITPHWQQIVDIDRRRITELGLDLAIVPASAELRAQALLHRDRELNERSGYPELIEQLDHRVIRPAIADADHRAQREATGMLDAAIAATTAELRALDDPEARATMARDAADATSRLEQLRGPGARWNIVLGDRVTDLTNETTHAFRSAIRGAAASIEERIESITKATQWDGLGRDLQSAVAEAVTQAFIGVEAGRQTTRDELAALLAADDVITPQHPRSIEPIDVAGMWSARELDAKESVQGKAFRTGLTGLRGAQGGVMLFGIGAQFLPQAGALFLASNPVLLSAGLVFGAHQLMEDRKRKVAARRQGARAQLRQFTDAVSFETTNQLGIRLREAQRDLRDEFVDLIGELQRTWADAAKAADEMLHRSEQETQARRSALHALLQRYERHRNDLGRLPGTPS